MRAGAIFLATMEKKQNKFKAFLRILGPGFVTGAADDDPTAIAAYTQAGAQFGYGQLWTALFTVPFMSIVQGMCGRIGIVTGNGLASVIKTHYSRRILYGAVTLLFVSNAVNIGADLGAMAASAQLLVKVPIALLLIIITAITLSLEIFFTYPKYVKYLKYLTLTLLAYIIVAFLVTRDWRRVALATVIPSFSFHKAYILSVLAILGTNISPYLFFWQASEEVEEHNNNSPISVSGATDAQTVNQEVNESRVDTIVGMVFSNIIVLFIAITAASTLGLHGITDIQTPAQAAEALRPLAGDLSFALFTIGIIGSGLLAVPVLAGSSSYALSETFGWEEGLSKRFKQAKGFYTVIIASVLIGLAVNLLEINAFKMLIYAAALNAVLAPPLLVLIILISSSKKIMGVYTNSLAAKLMGYSIAALMALASIGFAVSLLN